MAWAPLAWLAQTAWLVVQPRSVCECRFEGPQVNQQIIDLLGAQLARRGPERLAPPAPAPSC
eukprot:12123333-Alexandrium_andersonii.AAC.1